MTCEELKPDYLLYAMGTMGEPESGELRAHLDRGCPVCTEGLRQAHALAYSMGAALDGPQAPRALRGRVLAISGAGNRGAEGPGRVQFWMRPVARWQGWALAMGGVLLALAPGLVWYRELSHWRARQAATAALLVEEQRSSASLRELAADMPNSPVPIFALELERGGAPGEALKQLAIPIGAAAVVLALPTDLVRQASAAELRNGSGQTVWSASPLAVSDADSTGLTIPSRLLPPGRYEVVLAAENRPVARLPFQVTLR